MFEARASFALPTGSRVSNTRIPPRAIRCSDQLFSRETFVGHEGSGRVERYFGCSFCEGAHLEMRKAPCESAFCEGAHFLYPRLLTEMSNTNALVPVHHAIQSMNHQEVLRHVFRVFGAVFFRSRPWHLRATIVDIGAGTCNCGALLGSHCAATTRYVALIHRVICAHCSNASDFQCSLFLTSKT